MKKSLAISAIASLAVVFTGLVGMIGTVRAADNERDVRPTDSADSTEHWAYQLPVRPALPTVGDPRWSHPIDAFITKEYAQLGLVPVGLAGRQTLLRRLYLDLIGLPPTREQQRDSGADNSPEAWIEEVDALLDNPHYGERWGRHWMDVWRYSDWLGYKQEVRGSQKHIWRWRDWIVESLNEDKGYGRMIQEMLAGDELAPNDLATLEAAKNAIADATAGADSEKDQEKSDAGTPDTRLLELKKTAALLALQSLDARQAADREKYGVGEIENESSAAGLAMAAAVADRRHHAHDAVVIVREKELALQAAETHDEKDGKKKQQAVAKAKRQLDEAWKKLTEAQSALAKTDDQYTPVGKEYPRSSSGRRLALARWIATGENPLTARVAVNHIWLRHFGSPLVDNVFDFGLRSPRPRHADLLDWLAVELVENHWSMKHLHRLIVTSRTWRLASTGGSDVAANLEIDRDNNFLWRMNVRRLEAEIVRDSVLAVSGQLDTTLGGPEIDYQQGETSRRRSIYLRHAYEKQMAMLVQFDAASPNECYRRSESIVPQQALALTNSSLSLGHARRLAERLWEEVSSGNDDTGDSDDANDTDHTEIARQNFVNEAFRQILSRTPADQEASMCQRFLTDQTETLSDLAVLTPFGGGKEATVQPATDPRQRARENLVHVLMNHNDFVTVR